MLLAHWFPILQPILINRTGKDAVDPLPHQKIIKILVFRIDFPINEYNPALLLQIPAALDHIRHFRFAA